MTNKLAELRSIIQGGIDQRQDWTWGDKVALAALDALAEMRKAAQQFFPDLSHYI